MRPISKAEVEFLQAAFSAAGKDLGEIGISEESSVESLKDGGMGSIRFLASSGPEDARHMKSAILEGEFKDADGMLVSFSLDVDAEGKPYELDLWRVDFQPLKRLPQDANEITIRTKA